MEPMVALILLILVVVALLFPIVITLRLMCLACRALEVYIENNKGSGAPPSSLSE